MREQANTQASNATGHRDCSILVRAYVSRSVCIKRPSLAIRARQGRCRLLAYAPAVAAVGRVQPSIALFSYHHHDRIAQPSISKRAPDARKLSQAVHPLARYGRRQRPSQQRAVRTPGERRQRRRREARPVWVEKVRARCCGAHPHRVARRPSRTPRPNLWL